MAAEKTVIALFTVAFLALLISFLSSPPGTPAKPCLDLITINQL